VPLVQALEGRLVVDPAKERWCDFPQCHLGLSLGRAARNAPLRRGKRRLLRRMQSNLNAFVLVGATHAHNDPRRGQNLRSAGNSAGH
jgi:hypothetical protein